MLFSSEEYAQIISLLGEPQDIDPEDAVAIVKWAESTKVANSLLELALAGMLNVAMVNGEPKFTVTEEGQEVAKSATNRAFEEIIKDFDSDA